MSGQTHEQTQAMNAVAEAYGSYIEANLVTTLEPSEAVRLGEGDGFRQQRPRRDMPPVERGPRQSGTVKFFKNDKGFGFITPDEGDADVFVHISAVERSGFAGLDSGQRVSFETEPDRRGKGPKAVNLQALEEGDAPQEDDGGPAEE